jgi:flagellar hook-basal body complex protein FliE
MDITSIGGLASPAGYGVKAAPVAGENRNSTFEDMFKAAVNLVNDTNSYTNAAQEAETSFALGITDSTTDLQIAQQKANLALQYTVAIRNNIMEAYKDIMNLQF